MIFKIMDKGSSGRKERKMKVSECKGPLADREFEQLISQELVVKEAIASVEQVGPVSRVKGSPLRSEARIRGAEAFWCAGRDCGD